MTNDDTLRAALTKLADEWAASSCSGLVEEIRALLAAHPAPETVAEMLAREAADAETMPVAEGPYVRNRPTPVPDTRREDVVAGAEAAWRASQGVNGFAEEQWAHVPEPQRASWRYIARAVFASIDTDELARVLWPYPYPFEAALREHQAFYEGQAEAVKAHLLKEDATDD